MLFHLSHFSFLPPPLAPSPKAFPSSHVNYFLSEHTFPYSLFNTHLFFLPFLLSPLLSSLLSYFDSPVGSCQFSLVYLL